MLSIRRLVIVGSAFIIGVIPGFFVVFNSVFSDSGSLEERLFTFLLVIAAYSFLGLLLSFIAKDRSWLTWVSLSAPAIIILGLYSVKEKNNVGLNIVYACLTIGSSWLGSILRNYVKK